MNWDWAVSSVGRVPGSHPGGREFKSPTVHKREISSLFFILNFLLI